MSFESEKSKEEKCLEFIESAYTSSYALGSKPKLSSDGLYVTEANYYLRPELLEQFSKAQIETHVLKNNRTGNIVPILHEEQREKAKEVTNDLLDSYQYYLSNEEFKKRQQNMQRTIPRSDTEGLKQTQICKISNLSDFQMYAITNSLPMHKVYFTQHINTNGHHEIDFLAKDYKDVNQCLKETAVYLTSDAGIKKRQEFECEKKIFADIENHLKNEESIYIMSPENGKYLEITPQTYNLMLENNNGSVLAPGVNSSYDGNILKDDKAWTEMAIQVSLLPTPVSLTQNEFHLPPQERSELIAQRAEETIQSIQFDKTMTADKIFNDFTKNMDSIEQDIDNRNLIEELE